MASVSAPVSTAVPPSSLTAATIARSGGATIIFVLAMASVRRQLLRRQASCAVAAMVMLGPVAVFCVLECCPGRYVTGTASVALRLRLLWLPCALAITVSLAPRAARTPAPGTRALITARVKPLRGSARARPSGTARSASSRAATTATATASAMPGRTRASAPRALAARAAATSALTTATGAAPATPTLGCASATTTTRACAARPSRARQRPSRRLRAGSCCGWTWRSQTRPPR